MKVEANGSANSGAGAVAGAAAAIGASSAAAAAADAATNPGASAATTGFIFDMDGTLMDTIRAWHESELRLMEEAGATLSKTQRDELNALTLEEAGDFFHKNFGLGKDGGEVVARINEFLLDFYRTQAELNPGAAAFVQAVADAGAPRCVLSSSPQEFLQVGLSRTGLKHLFADDHIISAEDMGMTKRNPKTFEFVCNLLGTKPADTWLFDDSWYALATAYDVGLRTVGVYSSDGCGTHDELHRYCDIVVNDFTELDPARFL